MHHFHIAHNTPCLPPLALGTTLNTQGKLETVIMQTCGWYRKIPKISPGVYIFQRPFLRGLSTEGNLRFKTDWTSLIVEVNLPFLLCFTLYLRAIFQVQASGGLIFGGAI